jgi:DNA invertase Pin-like site-specific DNA recombinase
MCRAYRATLVIAKLDRLSRNAAFLLTLQESGAAFVAADMPDANNLTVGIMALVAQQEREAISARTKAALAVAKARGKRIGGGPGPQAADGARGRQAAAAARQDIAARRAADVLPVLARIQAEHPGMSLRALANRLNAEGVPTPSGRGSWQAVTVRRTMNRVLQIQPSR